MKTVLIDNSLCVYTLKDNANPEYVYNYIEELRDAGVRYVEMDFRAAMKLRGLPRNMGYIFRPVDPMFLKLCEIYDFDYVLLTFNDIQRGMETDVPVMLGYSAGENVSAKVYYLAKKLLHGEITAVKTRGSFPMMSPQTVEKLVSRMKNEVPVPINVCPMNGVRNALDTALKLTQAKVDALTLTLGVTDRFCTLQDYFFTLMTAFNKLPKEYNLRALCRAAVFHHYIFRNSDEFMINMFKLFEDDSRFLLNVDSGERVRLKMGLNNTNPIRKDFISALERMADAEEIPDDIFACIDDAVKSFEVLLYDRDVLRDKKRVFLN